MFKLTKYLKILFVRMNISNTNEYLFLILYTCINYNPPMYPYNYQQRIFPDEGYHCVSDILVYWRIASKMTSSRVIFTDRVIIEE